MEPVPRPTRPHRRKRHSRPIGAWRENSVRRYENGPSDAANVERPNAGRTPLLIQERANPAAESGASSSAPKGRSAAGEDYYQPSGSREDGRGGRPRLLD